MKSMKVSSIAGVLLHGYLSIAAPTVTVTVLPLPAVANPSPFPVPTTNEFQYLNYDENKDKDKGDRFVVHSAFVPFSDIMQKAISAVADTTDDTFDRWFPANVKQPNKQPSVDARGYVSSVYRRIISPGSNPAPQLRMTSLVHDLTDFANLCKPNTRAYMRGTVGQFHVCDPRGLTDQPMVAAPANCSSLGPLVSGAMQSLSGTLKHEFMHWNQVAEGVPNSVGHIADVEYGPASCMRLRQGPLSQTAFINADSYKWMALNAYYNSVCNKKFGDPVITQDDFDEGQALLLDSPEYDEAVSEGVLARV